jgi:hypothetical protein
MPLEAGSRFGRYVIEALLGKGGMGEVYRARDSLLRRPVALKILRAPTEPGDRDAGRSAAKILHEARVAAAFQHPNAVAIFDLGEHNGQHFLAMEFVSGRSLRELVGHPDVSVEQRVRWLGDIGRALDAAHRFTSMSELVAALEWAMPLAPSGRSTSQPVLVPVSEPPRSSPSQPISIKPWMQAATATHSGKELGVELSSLRVSASLPQTEPPPSTEPPSARQAAGDPSSQRPDNTDAVSTAHRTLSRVRKGAWRSWGLGVVLLGGVMSSSRIARSPGPNPNPDARSQQASLRNRTASDFCWIRPVSRANASRIHFVGIEFGFNPVVKFRA